MAETELPLWARVTDRRRAHIERVTALLRDWGAAMRIPREEAEMWAMAGNCHDALRDAPESALRALLPEADYPLSLLHGPAAAVLLARDGERRSSVLEAVRWHTVGYRNWDRTGRALYMADFLEPGRPFAREERTFLTAQVPRDFDGVFRQVVRLRLEMTLKEGMAIYPETVALWNVLQ